MQPLFGSHFLGRKINQGKTKLSGIIFRHLIIFRQLSAQKIGQHIFLRQFRTDTVGHFIIIFSVNVKNGINHHLCVNTHLFGTKFPAGIFPHGYRVKTPQPKSSQSFVFFRTDKIGHAEARCTGYFPRTVPGKTQIINAFVFSLRGTAPDLVGAGNKTGRLLIKPFQFLVFKQRRILHIPVCKFLKMRLQKSFRQMVAVGPVHIPDQAVADAHFVQSLLQRIPRQDRAEIAVRPKVKNRGIKFARCTKIQIFGQTHPSPVMEKDVAGGVVSAGGNNIRIAVNGLLQRRFFQQLKFCGGGVKKPAPFFIVDKDHAGAFVIVQPTVNIVYQPEIADGQIPLPRQTVKTATAATWPET